MKTKPDDTLYCGVRKELIESAKPELNWENIGHFRDFVIDRYRVHKKKDVRQQSAPWTTNPIIAEFKFTNVRREHDRQTRYLIENIIECEYLSLNDKIVNCFMFRAWNNWSTLKTFGFPYLRMDLSLPELKDEIRKKYYEPELKKHPDRKWWSNAFNQGGFKMVWGYPDGTAKSLYERDGADRHHEPDIPLRPFHIGPYLYKHHIVEKILKCSTQQEVFDLITTIPGFGDFMAYQVFVDLTYIEEFPFSENEFVIAGPGCKRGLDLIFEDKAGMTYEECIFWLRNHINECEGITAPRDLFNRKPILKEEKKYEPMKLFSDLPKHDRIMNVMSIENCMCELSKYVRAVNGTGRPRNKYKGGK